MVPLALLALVVLGSAFATPVPAQQQGFRDCARCPEMVALPAGTGHLESPSATREADRDAPATLEGRSVSIAPFAVGKYEVTRSEFAAFVEETGHGGGACKPGEVELKWCNLPFPQSGRDPVVQVGWRDALSYAEWLSQKTGWVYRLPTGAEWEYAARGGSSTSRDWENDRRSACRFGNLADLTFAQTYGSDDIFDCTDGFPNTAPVGTFPANGFGLYDMLGNAWVVCSPETRPA